VADKITIEVLWTGGGPLKQTMELDAARALVVQAARLAKTVGEPDA
jgi:hypothetical protein